MGFLLAKFTLIFLLAAVLSFILGHWWARRGMIDVTRSFEKLWSGRQIGEGDGLSAVSERLDAISEALSAGVARAGESQAGEGGSGASRKPLPELKGIQNRLGGIEQRLEAIRIPEPQEFDTSELVERLDSLEKWIMNLRIPEPPAITPLERRIDLLSSQVAKTSVTAADIPELNYLMEQVGRVEKKLVGQIGTDRSAIDLTPLLSRLDKIDAAVSKLTEPANKTNARAGSAGAGLVVEELDEPSSRRLERQDQSGDTDEVISAIELLSRRADMKQASATPSAGDNPTVPQDSAAQGRPDNLMRIQGIGRRLEKLLNSHGIHYFWQIAEWSEDDAERMNRLLDNADNRIQDEEWIAQAMGLSISIDAARKPG